MSWLAVGLEEGLLPALPSPSLLVYLRPRPPSLPACPFVPSVFAPSDRKAGPATEGQGIHFQNLGGSLPRPHHLQLQCSACLRQKDRLV